MEIMNILTSIKNYFIKERKPINTLDDILNDSGRFLNYPGIENEELVMEFFKGKVIEPVVRFRSEFERQDNGRHLVIWQIQPDGRYWADEDGFGAESDYEIRLYSYVDEYGNFTAPFRIYNIGATKYFGTDHEEIFKQELEEKKAAEKKRERSGNTVDDDIKFLINKCLGVIIDEVEKWPFFTVFDIPKSKYMAQIVISKDAITKVKWRLRVGVLIEHTDKVLECYINFAYDKEEMLQFLTLQETKDDIFKTIKELNEKAPDRL